MAHEKFAQAIAREIPAPYIGRFLESFHGVKLANANGNGCGNACGNSCIDGVGFVVDRYGHAGLSAHELEAAQKDIRGLRASIDSEIGRSLK
jgi:hypothetical protein